MDKINESLKAIAAGVMLSPSPHKLHLKEMEEQDSNDCRFLAYPLPEEQMNQPDHEEQKAPYLLGEEKTTLGAVRETQNQSVLRMKDPPPSA